MQNTGARGDPLKSIAVLDLAPQNDRRLAETVRGAGMEPLDAERLSDVESLLRSGASRVGLVAFEALWPDPQAALLRLKEAQPGARIVVVYSEGGPRLRL